LRIDNRRIFIPRTFGLRVAYILLYCSISKRRILFRAY